MNCPSCGYCSHCGRGGHYARPYNPWYQPLGPWYSNTGLTSNQTDWNSQLQNLMQANQDQANGILQNNQ